MSVDCIMTLSNDFMSSSSNVVTLERKVEESSIFHEDVETKVCMLSLPKV